MDLALKIQSAQMYKNPKQIVYYDNKNCNFIQMIVPYFVVR